ncbi:MAG: PIN domain-containing protein [Actinobacteria bacterium]|nr:PIN domain-containing protein [Actinomycetota bacterium]
MKGNLVDTNIFIRLLTEDDPDQAAASKDFISRVIAGKVHAYITVAVILEIVWTLSSYYKLSRDDISHKLTLLLNTKKLAIENRDIIEEAAEYYKTTPIDFADCYNAAYAKLIGDAIILSYDKDFDRIKDVRRVEP